MSEVVYSKKQITPLMEKFSINPSNDNFKEIITMFQDQTNYQIWAIKAVFSGIVSLDTIKQIKAWADANQTEIHNLIKGNIVAYKSASEFHTLLQEMRGLDMISAVKSTISRFNTQQREMLRQNILNGIHNGMDAISSSAFTNWFNLFKQMEKLSANRKEKLISLASAINSMSLMKEHITSALNQSYEWNKEDMLAFMERNCSDCKVVYDKDNIVIINVPSFASSQRMCGGGRTSWCLTREERYFRQYVIDPQNAKQYFYFDFSKRENHELAHVGFTVQEGRGITNAHSTKNTSMAEGGRVMVDGQPYTIHDVLTMNGIPHSIYMKLKKLTKYKWNLEDFLAYIAKNPNDYALSVNSNRRVIVRVMNHSALGNLVGHSFIDIRNISVNKDSKTYVFLDFNLPMEDDMSMMAINYVKDGYGYDSLRSALTTYGANFKGKDYLATLGITTEMYLNREEIAPTILLHKLIDEGSEAEAIRLIEKQGEDFDVNTEFAESSPIFKAIDKKMYGLFSVIVNHKKFDSTSCDGFGETLLQSLLYNYKMEGITTPENDETVKNMINTILESKNFDFNAQDINYDTALTVACERKELLWVVEALIAKPSTNVNLINDFNCGALGTAIRKGNLDAIPLLATRKDLMVRPEDMELAAAHGVDISEIAKSHADVKVENVGKTSDLYSELFAKVFAKAN